MSIAVTLNLPDQVYDQAERLAQQRQQKLERLLVDEIAEIIAAQLAPAAPHVAKLIASGSLHEPDEAVAREREAYIALHPYLKEHFLGKHVAIYQGKLIDFDDDYDTLYTRINAKYPDVFVWLDTVSAEPLEIVTLRSPLFVEP